MLAGLIRVTDRELADLQQSYSRKEICALHLIEKWMVKNPQKNKDDLYQLLKNAQQIHAAERLVFFIRGKGFFHQNLIYDRYF